MIVQPQSPPQLKTNLRTWLISEWNHLAGMPLSTLAWLAIPTLITFWFNPLLPVLAYALQVWAGQSFQWKSHWGSIRLWAREGGWFVGTLVALGILADVHIWFFPALVALAQTAWRDHVPGELSLLPFPLQPYNTLFARLMLLWPLAPTLALLYERIDPRTQVDPPRQLLARDLVQSQGAVPPAGPSTPPPGTGTDPGTDPNAAQPKPAASTPPSSAASKRPKTAQAKQPGTPAESQDLEQLTIDSILTPDQTAKQGQANTSQPLADRTHTSRPTGAPSSGTAHKKKKQGRDQAQATTEPGTLSSKAKQPETINWDDVAE